MDAIAPNRSWGPELDRKARAVHFLLLDVDGVLTDGRLHVGIEGDLFKSFHVRDGLAVKLAQAAGLRVGILSARSSDIVARRAAEVGIEEVVQGHADKGVAFEQLRARLALDAGAIAYVGDDLQDLAVLSRVGLAAAPADAVEAVRSAVDYVTGARGGEGCVRELVERLLVARGAWATVLSRFAPPSRDDAAG